MKTEKIQPRGSSALSRQPGDDSVPDNDKQKGTSPAPATRKDSSITSSKRTTTTKANGGKQVDRPNNVKNGTTTSKINTNMNNKEVTKQKQPRSVLTTQSSSDRSREQMEERSKLEEQWNTDFALREERKRMGEKAYRIKKIHERKPVLDELEKSLKGKRK